MGYVKVPDHRRPLRFGSRPSGSTTSLSLPQMAFIYRTFLCLTLLLLPLLANAGRLHDDSDVLDGPITFDLVSSNTTWEAGGYADITLRVQLGSDTSASLHDAAYRRSLDDINMLLTPYRSNANHVLSSDSALALISQDRHGEDVLLRYRWPVPACLRSGRHIQLRTSSFGRRQPLAVPIFVVAPDEARRLSCSSRLQTYIRAPGRYNHQLQFRAKRSPSLSARDDGTGGDDGYMTSTPPFSATTAVAMDPTDYPPSWSSNYTSGAGSYTPSTPYSASYTAWNYSPTPTSYTSSGAYSTNSTSVVVVTSTATQISVQTITSVSTDIETMVTTVTGPDSTEVITTTQTLISTMMIVETTAAGLLPVNGAAYSAVLSLSAIATVCVTTAFWLLCSANCCVL
ncbi:hypothetical protein DAEQUDRAFT_807067 [Daedalea quercina L-15889]|uniref:Uncharacterized protein n=1 Tax=Daedalea quercina L-15889 TaxID=1314783 RepID=A0A165UD33_9APHY|nr:hypothetical protein DAEQUDRAFT_807067 [Daedalea quercina L-15889]